MSDVRRNNDGFVIRVPGGHYIENVVNVWSEEKRYAHVVDDIRKAKIYHQPCAARKARSQAGLGGRILLVRQDAQGNRVIVGQLGKAAGT